MNNEQFDVRTVQLSNLAKAIAHPARIEILRKIANHGTCICGEIVESLPLAQATVSQHLKALKEAGLICGEIEGSKSCYCIDYKQLSELKFLLDSFFTGVESARQKCNC
ncbi:MAG: winged helix-turn-helix transcriptional regulator [Ignavibacteriae bacterium]|nr:winged helix-turn-helix transcriptional regulator [Ignavibacteriota bacterium]